MAEQTTEQRAVTPSWETPSAATDGRPAQPIGTFALRGLGEILAVAAAVVVVLACVWTYMLIR